MTTARVMLLCLLFSSYSHAVTVKNLYRASVDVESKQARERTLGFTLALQEVLVKLIGDESQLLQPGVNALLSKPDAFVQSYAFEDNPDFQAQPLASSDDESAGQHGLDSDDQVPATPVLPYRLTVAFSPAALGQAMSDLGLPVWGAERPSILLWTVSENRGKRSITSASDIQVTQSAEHIAQQRGLPIYFPVMDLVDINAINIDELWGLYHESIAEASKRYAPDVVVMLRITNLEGAAWGGDWSMFSGQQVFSGNVRANTEHGVWRQVLAKIGASLAASYAISNSSEGLHEQLDIVISNVKSFSAYARVKQYLENLPPLKASNLSWVSQDRVAYRVELAASREQFHRHLQLGGRLWPEPVVDLPVLDFASQDLVMASEVNTELRFYTEREPVEDKREFYRWQVAEGAEP